MRKVTAGLFISLDGVVEAPHLWQFDVFDADMTDAMIKFLAGIDTALLGRVTYNEWAGYWPTAEDPYGDFINNVPKYVASTTLERVDWQNSTLIQGDVAATVARLKGEPGGDIAVQGSPTLVRYLLSAGLLDELTLMIHPVVAGRGKRLFTGDEGMQRLRLVDSRITGSGVAILTYGQRNA
ncbi:MAG: dihydrofolate reductase family protein [Candidatus Promineofilum sp.]|nr:dihydrofolate reductase family protein [Promineifilum sp.]